MVIVFRVKPMKYVNTNEPSIERGMAVAVIRVATIFRRKENYDGREHASEYQRELHLLYALR